MKLVNGYVCLEAEDINVKKFRSKLCEDSQKVFDSASASDQKNYALEMEGDPWTIGVSFHLSKNEKVFEIEAWTFEGTPVRAGDMVTLTDALKRVKKLLRNQKKG